MGNVVHHAERRGDHVGVGWAGGGETVCRLQRKNSDSEKKKGVLWDVGNDTVPAYCDVGGEGGFWAYWGTSRNGLFGEEEEKGGKKNTPVQRTTQGPITGQAGKRSLCWHVIRFIKQGKGVLTSERYRHGAP